MLPYWVQLSRLRACARFFWIVRLAAVGTSSYFPPGCCSVSRVYLYLSTTPKGETIQAVRLKGAHTIVTGLSDAVAEAIVNLGIEWGGIETLADLQTGLRTALARMGRRIEG